MGATERVMEYIEKYRQVQSIAKQVHLELANAISEVDSEATISEKAMNFLATHEITETLYHMKNFRLK